MTLKMDGKTIAKRNILVEEYNDNVIYSLRLNQLMHDMRKLIIDALRDKSITDEWRLLEKGYFTRKETP